MSGTIINLKISNKKFVIFVGIICGFISGLFSFGINAFFSLISIILLLFLIFIIHSKELKILACILFIIAHIVSINSIKLFNQEINIFQMSAKGNLFIVKLLSKTGTDLNAQNSSSLTPLMYASLNGKINVVEELIRSNVEINAKTRSGRTALMFASRNGYKDIANILIKNGANVNITDSYDFSAIVFASSYGHSDIFELLLNSGSSLENKTGIKSLVYSALNGHTDIVKRLIEVNIDVNLTIENCDTILLSETLDNGSADVAFYKPNIEKGITLVAYNERYYWGKSSILIIDKINESYNFYDVTALMCAAYNNHLEIVNELVNAGADVNIRDYWGNDALIYCTRKQGVDFSTAEILLDSGASINFENYLGFNSLFYALNNNNNNLFKKLIIKCYDITFTDKYGHTLLMYAANNENIEIMQYLIDSGCKVNSKNELGITALMYAAYKGYNDAIQILLSNHALIDKTDFLGHTALMFAAGNNKLESVKLLIEKGADINKTNKYGFTPIFFASGLGHSITDQNIENTNLMGIEFTYKKPIFFSNGNYSNLVTALIENDAQVNHKSNEGYTPLMYAIAKNDYKILKALIAAGANKEEFSNNGLNIFDIANACQSNNIKNDEILKLILDID